jgi:hypothetical protein
MKEINLSKKTKGLIYFLITLNFGLLGLYWLFSIQVGSNISQISNLGEDLNFQLAKERQLKSMKNISRETQSERIELDSYFVSSDGIVSFIKEVEGLATLSGLEVEIDSVGTTEYFAGEDLSEILEILGLNLRVKGEWSSSFYFLNLLERMPYQVSFDQFSLEAENSTEDEASNWKGRIGLKVLKIK